MTDILDQLDLDTLPDLTPKQFKFVLGLHAGMDASKAYREAGYSTRQANESIWVRACELQKNENVRAWLDAIKATSLANAEGTREKLLSELWRAIQQASSKEQVGAIASLASQISRMQGWDAPSKQETRVQADVTNHAPEPVDINALLTQVEAERKKAH